MLPYFLLHTILLTFLLSHISPSVSTGWGCQAPKGARSTAGTPWHKTPPRLIPSPFPLSFAIPRPGGASCGGTRAGHPSTHNRSRKCTCDASLRLSRCRLFGRSLPLLPRHPGRHKLLTYPLRVGGGDGLPNFVP